MFFLTFVEHVENLMDPKERPVVFAIGRALSGRICEAERKIMGQLCKDARISEARISAANRAVKFYNEQIEACRQAVDAWTIVGRRNCIVKDLRRLIGMIIWNDREKACYRIK